MISEVRILLGRASIHFRWRHTDARICILPQLKILLHDDFHSKWCLRLSYIVNIKSSDYLRLALDHSISSQNFYRHDQLPEIIQTAKVVNGSA